MESLPDAEGVDKAEEEKREPVLEGDPLSDGVPDPEEANERLARAEEENTRLLLDEALAKGDRVATEEKEGWNVVGADEEGLKLLDPDTEGINTVGKAEEDVVPVENSEVWALGDPCENDGAALHDDELVTTDAVEQAELVNEGTFVVDWDGEVRPDEVLLAKAVLVALASAVRESEENPDGV
jgi:hypothetical protein